MPKPRKKRSTGFACAEAVDEICRDLLQWCGKEVIHVRAIPNWRQKLLFTALMAGIILMMYLLKTGCIIRRMTGIPCPGCGMTRAVLAILRGDIAGALRLHGMVWSLPVIYVIYLYDGRVFSAKWMNIALIALLAAGFILQWIF